MAVDGLSEIRLVQINWWVALAACLPVLRGTRAGPKSCPCHTSSILVSTPPRPGVPASLRYAVASPVYQGVAQRSRASSFHSLRLLEHDGLERDLRAAALDVERLRELADHLVEALVGPCISGLFDPVQVDQQ